MYSSKERFVISTIPSISSPVKIVSKYPIRRARVYFCHFHHRLKMSLTIALRHLGNHIIARPLEIVNLLVAPGGPGGSGRTLAAGLNLGASEGDFFSLSRSDDSSSAGRDRVRDFSSRAFGLDSLRDVGHGGLLSHGRGDNRGDGDWNGRAGRGPGGQGVGLCLCLRNDRGAVFGR